MDVREGAATAAFEAELAGLRRQIECCLAEITPGEPSPRRLAEAMRYILLAPAKRARALLALLSAQHCGGVRDDAMAAACALEMVHAASLILDDLPAMDDARLRRGQAACHRVYGEATATLAAIALMNRAFSIVAADGRVPPDRRIAVVAILSRSIGTDGLTGGQEGDLHGSGLEDVAGVDWVHARKTGALFAAAAEIGAAVAGATARQAALHKFGMKLGLAFQGYDDLIDARAAASAVGKDTGRDGGKATLVASLGFDAALARADAQVAAALACWPELRPGGGPLARYVASLTAQLRVPLAREPTP